MAPFHHQAVEPGHSRLVIAASKDHTISRRQGLLSPLAPDRVRLENLSDRLAVGLPDGSRLAPGADCELPLPAVVTFGKIAVRVQEVDTAVLPLHGLAEMSMPPGVTATTSVPFASLLASAGPGIDRKALVGWLRAAMAVLQSAASSSDFFTKAARTVVDLVGLDAGRILLLEHGEWRDQTPQLRRDRDTRPSQTILNRVRQEKRTFWEVPLDAASMCGVQAVVAAPILNRHGEVIGRSMAIAGGRPPAAARRSPSWRRCWWSCSPAAWRRGWPGWSRSSRPWPHGYSSSSSSRRSWPGKLAAQPDLLDGRDAEVTVLFCDIRGFSRISERLGPARTFEWIGAVMGELSECVLRQEGVLVDYIGDELMAMWGAPEAQPDHAARACRAGLDMLGRLPGLNAHWQPILQEPMSIGVGINTGMARVGNTGSPHKYKYGPLGNTVNLASRVQGAPSTCKPGCLITGSTQARLDASFSTRRVCVVRVVNIAKPVPLYELGDPAEPGWSELGNEYEQALVEFERQEFRKAVRILGNLLATQPQHGPSLVLLARAVTLPD